MGAHGGAYLRIASQCCAYCSVTCRFYAGTWRVLNSEDTPMTSSTLLKRSTSRRTRADVETPAILCADLGASHLLHGDCLTLLKTLEADSVDLVCTDPPYGIGFMGKEWDTFKHDYIGRQMETDNKSFAKRSHAHKPKDWKLPSHSPAQIAGKYSFAPDAAKNFGKFIEAVGRECVRVMKPGAFLFLCMTPRQDSLARVIVALEDAGLRVGFTSLYWTFASGFPKARNIGKETNDPHLQGAYGGFQPKPAVEVILVAMKPMREKTFAAQATCNGKGITWLDDGRIPYQTEDEKPAKKVNYPDMRGNNYGQGKSAYVKTVEYETNQTGRFPANLLVSDDILAGTIEQGSATANIDIAQTYSRYFSLDAWSANLPESARQTFPFLIVPKASKREKNAGLEGHQNRASEFNGGGIGRKTSVAKRLATNGTNAATVKNQHPTVKPLQLMRYLITIGSRPGDVVLDPFLGSGTTAVAAKELGRRYVGIERERDYFGIAKARLAATTVMPRKRM
ncbi:MAG TPA: site-specific DNA-methyltransferase [Rhizomicrobium sp.]|nr:site-specific DNA-methyltransferase [Rhizomicrobium sp.]